MSVLDSVYVGLFGMSVVFIVLIGLSLLIRFQALLVSRFSRSRAAEPEEGEAAVPETYAADEPLKLINVDEKTAAMVMAIVCDEIQAQPEELRFRSIRVIDEDDAK